MMTPRSRARLLLQIEAEAVSGLIEGIGSSFERTVEALRCCRGRVVVTGIGKSGIICMEIAETLSGSGIPAFWLHAAEALHGDLGMIMRGDIVLAVSNSGETEELLKIASAIRGSGVMLISLTGSLSSSLARASDLHLEVRVSREGCHLGLAPTASTTAVLAMGHALAAACVER